MSILRTQVELRSPSDLKPYKRNHKKHPPEQIKKLSRSIAEHGFDQPIVVDRQGVIIKGHGRHAAALEMGLKQVPVIVAADLTPEQVRAARLADNAIADDGLFDFEAIRAELSDLSDLGLDLRLTGFDEDELDRIIGDLELKTEYQPPQVFQSFASPEPPELPPEPMEETEKPEPEPEPPKGSGVNGDRFPLAIVLDWADYNRWRAAKEALGQRLDKTVLLLLLDRWEESNG